MEVLAEKEEQERAMRAQIRALCFQVKELAKTINETLAASRFAGDEVCYYDMNNEETRRGIVRYDEETAAFYVGGILQILVYFEPHFEYKLTPKQ